MDVLMIILGLIFLVFGVLQIVLFFKLWGMTNDVREMKGDLQKVAALNFASCENAEIRKKFCIDEMNCLMLKQTEGYTYNHYVSNFIKSQLPLMTSQFQAVIEKYNCSEILSVEDYKNYICDKYNVVIED